MVVIILKLILVIGTLGNYGSYIYGKLKGKQDKLDEFTGRAHREIQIQKFPSKIKL